MSRRVCFVTGTRAEFGLMRRTLSHISRTGLQPVSGGNTGCKPVPLKQEAPLRLQIIATGTHLDRARGYTVDDITAAGFRVDTRVPWPEASKRSLGIETGRAMGKIAAAIERLDPEIVLVVGDRVEAFAAASAAHLAGRVVAHVHGGDRALGQVDDALRHAITKLSHVHFAASPQSARRLHAMGEDTWRIIRSGAPGIDGINDEAATHEALIDAGLPVHEPFALLLYHPESADGSRECRAIQSMLRSLRDATTLRTIALLPNNDPGSEGIARRLEVSSRQKQARLTLLPHASRDVFLGLLRECCVLLGNSSAGIIEASSFHTPVLNIGARQLGREAGKNVQHASLDVLSDVLAQMQRNNFKRRRVESPYGDGTASEAIATTLAEIELDRFRGKLIRY